MCVCVKRPPFRVVCTNNEVVVFQPWTETKTYLGSVAIVNNFVLALPSPPASTVFGFL